MTAHNCLYSVAIIFTVMGWAAQVCAEDDVTVLSTSGAATAPSKKTVASDGTPVIHKSLHKKKRSTTVATDASLPTPESMAKPEASAEPSAVGNNTVKKQSLAAVTTTPQPPSIATNANALHPVPASLPNPTSVRPTVETGLPVARYPGLNIPVKQISALVPTMVTLPEEKSMTGATTHQPLFAALPSSVIPGTASGAGSYSPPSRTTSPSSDFVFTNFKKPSNRYPWKTGIITTEFWIGEGGSNISSTDNVASAWDENWRSTNRGSDNPNDRNGFASAEHASTVNPFYVALPFNDLAFPDKAREWVPRGWHRPNQDGKQVSACQHRWVWIKNAQGRSCFAQWEDVGPLRYDHAEYVFGDERPNTYTRAGLDVSPAVAQYLGINENKRAITSWRFVDDADVPPGAWLKYDEQAVIFTALHQLKTFRSSPDLPIQRATEPIDDPENIDSNKKKVDASKG